MPGFNRVHGSTSSSAASSFSSGYAMTFYKVVANSTITTDTVNVTTNEITTEGMFTTALKVIETISSIVYVGTKDTSQFVVAVDGLTAGQTGPAYNTDTSPTVTERIKAELDAAIPSRSFTITDISGLASGDLA